MNTKTDVVIIGGGNAALCAAITATRLGVKVLILEAAPKPYRGGNSRHTRNMRCMHKQQLEPLIDSYTEAEYFADLMKVTAAKTNIQLAKMTINKSEESVSWMKEQGVRFQPALSGTLSLARTNAFFRGGGKALVNALYQTASTLGIKTLYDASVNHIELMDNEVKYVTYEHNGEKCQIHMKALVVACETSGWVIEGGLDKRSSLDSIQQALFFAYLTGKQPVIVIYDTDAKFGKYEYRIQQAAKLGGIQFKIISTND